MVNRMKSGNAFRSMPLLATAVILLYMSGCATVLRGTKQDVAVTSAPGGASVYVDGDNAGMTPCTVELKRNSSHTIRVELAGYQPYEVRLENKFSIGWSIASLLVNSPLGLVIDIVTGAVYTIDPGTVSASFSDSSASIDTEDDSQFKIFVTMEKPDANWVKVGQMEKITVN